MTEEQVAVDAERPWGQDAPPPEDEDIPAPEETETEDDLEDDESTAEPRADEGGES